MSVLQHYYTLGEHLRQSARSVTKCSCYNIFAYNANDHAKCERYVYICVGAYMPHILWGEGWRRFSAVRPRRRDYMNDLFSVNDYDACETGAHDCSNVLQVFALLCIDDGAKNPRRTRQHSARSRFARMNGICTVPF